MKKVSKILSILMLSSASMFGGGFFDSSIGDIENWLRFAPAILAGKGCMGQFKAYEAALANQSVRRFYDLEKEHQQKIDDAAATLRQIVYREQNEALKQLNIIAVLQQQQAIAEKHKAFLMEKNNQIQNININMRAVGQ